MLLHPARLVCLWVPISTTEEEEFCGQNYLLKSTAVNTMCAGQECDALQDVNSCCVMRESCSTMSCPKGEGLKRNHEQLFCVGLDSDVKVALEVIKKELLGDIRGALMESHCCDQSELHAHILCSEGCDRDWAQNLREVLT